MQWKRLETDNGYVYSEVFDPIPTWGTGELGSWGVMSTLPNLRGPA